MSGLIPPTEQDPNIDNFHFPDQATPWASTWWTTQWITQVPGESVGWLLSQGWQITSITYDATTTPPTPYYAMTRESVNNTFVLQSLLNSYTVAYNDARYANQERYNEVVNSWTTMIDNTNTDFDAQATEHNAQVSIFTGNLATYMAEVDALINANQSQLVLDAADAETALDEMVAKLVDLEMNVSMTTTEIEALLNDQTRYLDSFLTDFSTELAELDANYATNLAIVNPFISTLSSNLSTFVTTINTLLTTILADYTTLEASITERLAADVSTLSAHAADYDSVLAMLEVDYMAHSETATEYLTDLGVTETARIAEKYAATLSTQMQQLVDKGLYSSVLPTDITARNARDHIEELGLLNDRLMREKLENQHRLYGQQTQMRTGTMAGKDHVYGLRAELSRYHASQVTGLYGLLQEVRNRTIATKQMILSLQDAVARYTIEVRNGLLAILNNIVGQQAAGIEKKHDAQQDVSRVITTQRERLLAMLQDATKGVISGKDRFAAAKMQLASTLADHRHRAIVEKMNEFAVQLETQRGVEADNMKLMMFQLDERNKLLIGLYGFVERREDIGPEFKDLAQITTALGDAGGGWLTP